MNGYIPGRYDIRSNCLVILCLNEEASFSVQWWGRSYKNSVGVLLRCSLFITIGVNMSYLLILVVFYVANSGIYCNPSSIKELHVGIGQQISFSLSKYIDLPSPTCFGLVLTSDSANNYVGTVRPRRFSCNNDRLTYTHYGREHPKEHSVKFLLNTGTFIKRAVLHIRFFIANSTNLFVQPLLLQNAGDSIRMNKKHFQYTGHNFCQVLVARPPRHGALLLAKPDVWEYSCKQIATGALTYKHFRYGHDIDDFLFKITLANFTIHQQVIKFNNI